MWFNLTSFSALYFVRFLWHNLGPFNLTALLFSHSKNVKNFLKLETCFTQAQISYGNECLCTYLAWFVFHSPNNWTLRQNWPAGHWQNSFRFFFSMSLNLGQESKTTCSLQCSIFKVRSRCLNKKRCIML